MKIILCYPPEKKYQGYGQETRWLPLGIASIGAYLKSKDKDLDIVLLDLYKDTEDEALVKIKRHIDAYKTNIVGFTMLTEQRFSVINLCKKVSEIKNKYALINDIFTVVGGVHAHIMANQLADNYNFIDYIIKGEGEKPFYNLVDYFKNKLWTKNIHMKRIIGPEYIENIDTIQHAIDGFELFDEIPEFEEAPIIFSRGCTDYCSFCSTTKFWNGYRSRSASNVFDEMLKYYTKFGTKYFKFHDKAMKSILYKPY
jgi:anaerobic magnesium-protoporphyrin IX monomethyl ester cyclase